MPANQFKRDMIEEAKGDCSELLTSIAEHTFLPRDLYDAVRTALEVAWMTGAMWALKDGRDRVDSMVGLIAEQALQDMRTLVQA